MKNLELIGSPGRTPAAGMESSFHGTILIPDISGFTKFVKETAFSTGREITRKLLHVIIDHNILNLEISEIEGDAVLFYKKSSLSPIQIKQQFEVMLQAFRKEVAVLSEDYGLKIDLTLKLIAHYGELSTYRIGNFEKLYGTTVIEAHRLLKNSIQSNSYFLLTDSIFFAAKNAYSGSCYYSGSQLCEIYGDLKKIGYTYFDYERDKDIGTIKYLGERADHSDSTLREISPMTAS